jgi:hypothetical protein
MQQIKPSSSIDAQKELRKHENKTKQKKKKQKAMTSFSGKIRVKSFSKLM